MNASTILIRTLTDTLSEIVTLTDTLRDIIKERDAFQAQCDSLETDLDIAEACNDQAKKQIAALKARVAELEMKAYRHVCDLAGNV